MRLFIFLLLLKPNAKWLDSPKEQLFYLPLLWLVAHARLSDRVQQFVGHFLPWKNWLAPTHEHQSMATLKFQAHFGIGPPTFRSSNYSSYKTSTLLLVKPQYNNTTKHFKEATHISREK